MVFKSTLVGDQIVKIMADAELTKKNFFFNP